MNKYTLDKNWFVYDYVNHLERNFSIELGKEFSKEFKKYTNDPFDSHYTEKTLAMITNYAIENIDFQSQKIEKELKENGKNRFVRIIKDTYESSGVNTLATMLINGQPNLSIFDKVFSIKNISGDLVEFNEINGNFNISLINKIYDEGSGYTENQTFYKEFIESKKRIVPNYAIMKTKESNNELVQIYIGNSDFDPNLFEVLAYKRDDLKNEIEDIEDIEEISFDR